MPRATTRAACREFQSTGKQTVISPKATVSSSPLPQKSCTLPAASWERLYESMNAARLPCGPIQYGIPRLDDGPLLCDAWGNVWIGGSSMLTRWRQGSSTTYAIKGLESGGDFPGVQALANAPDGSLMVGMTRSGPTLGLQQLDGVWKPFVARGLDGRNLAIDALFLDREKALWIGTSAEGLYRVYDGTVDHFHGADGLSGEAVYSFYEDNEGDVWAVTFGGLDRFRDFNVTSFSIREGLKGMRSKPSWLQGTERYGSATSLLWTLFTMGAYRRSGERKACLASIHHHCSKTMPAAFGLELTANCQSTRRGNLHA